MKEERNVLAVSVGPREVEALLEVERAARARFEVWTRETYARLERALKQLDEVRAQSPQQERVFRSMAEIDDVFFPNVEDLGARRGKRSR